LQRFCSSVRVLCLEHLGGVFYLDHSHPNMSEALSCNKFTALWRDLGNAVLCVLPVVLLLKQNIKETHPHVSSASIKMTSSVSMIIPDPLQNLLPYCHGVKFVRTTRLVLLGQPPGFNSQPPHEICAQTCIPRNHWHHIHSKETCVRGSLFDHLLLCC
jgi:hypothetical protein